MKSRVPTLKRAILFFGDAFVFYAALLIALGIRYGATWVPELSPHLAPFTVIFLVGIVIFYAMRLYDVAVGPTQWVQSTVVALSLHFFASVFFFYFFTRWFFTVTPRGTLFLFFVVFSFAFLAWRKMARSLLLSRFRERVLIVGKDALSQQLVEWLHAHPEVGYDVTRALTPDQIKGTTLLSTLTQDRITTLIADRESLNHAAPQLLASPGLALHIWDLALFCETRLEKIPLTRVDNAWILQFALRRESSLGASIKTGFDYLGALLFLLLTLPLWPVISLAIRMTSPGPVFYSQARVGQNGHVFKLHKFRTMRQDAEADGAQWSKTNDPRVTLAGKILRKAHLDELPQLLNILAGDMSFVGPRPERPEFVRDLETHVPHYAVRHFVKPGLTGWAQLNYPYGSSVEDAAEKLQYDLYYLKHRSFMLDISIVLKTVRLFFHNPIPKR